VAEEEAEGGAASAAVKTREEVQQKRDKSAFSWGKCEM